MTVEGFESMDIDTRILRALAKLGYITPTLVQSKAIPLALMGKDIVARARTGSGKTSAYCIPILQKMLQNPKTGIRAIVLVPTKELSAQVAEHFNTLVSFCRKEFAITNICQSPLEVSCQMEQNHIVVGTPSKVLVAIEQLSVKESLEFLVVDEADLILSFGYDQEMVKLLPNLPQFYQSFLMSATLTDKVNKLKGSLVKNAAILKLEDGQDDLLSQYSTCTTEQDRFLILFYILKLKVHPFGDGKTIIFVNNADQCYRVKLFLEQFGIRSCALNSELPLMSRHHIVEQFNNGVYDIIVATDDSCEQGKELDSDDENPMKKSTKKTDFGVSRGVDFKKVQVVLNFDLPPSSKAYSHRVGRTARGVGNEGFSLSFVLNDQSSIFERICRKQEAAGRSVKNFDFDMQKIESFRYRVNDAMRAVTKVAIKEARVKEIKAEIFNSEKLKAHFEDNPHDLLVLKHDRPLHPAKVQHHLTHIPIYLMPKRHESVSQQESDLGHVTFKKSRKRDKNDYKTTKKRASDPLRVFK